MRKSLFRFMLVAVLASPSLQAATIPVTTDSGNTGGPDCTLRDAITAANTDTVTGGCPAGNGADVIELPTAAVIDLTVWDNTTVLGGASCPNGLPIVISEIQINGNAAQIRRIDPDEGPPFRIFAVGETGNLTLRELVADGDAGPPFVSCQLACQLAGLAYNEGSLTLIEVSLTDSTINGTAGVYNSGTLRLVNSAITRVGNCIGGNGGAIFNDTTGTAVLIDSTMSQNESYMLGGALHNLGAATLIRCTINRNDSFYASGIANLGNMTLTNSTVSDNDVPVRFGRPGGAAVLNEGTLTIANSTITGNHNGGGEPMGSVMNSGTLWLDNTIIANSLSGVSDCVDTGTVHDVGHNIVERGSCISAPTSLSGNPDLGPLADNGGPTLTHALLPGSIAVDAGDCSGGSVETDQRGAARPQGPSCDIGAFELAPNGPGRVTDLSVDKSGSDLLLSWGTDCGTGDRYGVYRGDLALGYSSIAWDACDIATNTATTEMGTAGGEFFLVVPAWNGQEGSYGRAGQGQRPAAANACHVQGVIDWCAQ